MRSIPLDADALSDVTSDAINGFTNWQKQKLLINISASEVKKDMKLLSRIASQNIFTPALFLA
jgi:hypothetical protein